MNSDLSIERVNILGVGVSAINMSIALEAIENWIQSRQTNYICITGVHGVIESQRNELVRQVHNQAGLVTPDGMPLVWLSRLQGFRQVDRVYGPDLMLAVCQRSIENGNYRHFFFGGMPEVTELLAERLTSRFPGLIVAGAYSPPFRPLTVKENQEIVERINVTQPDIVWVGLSTPKQELWMKDHVSKLTAPVLIGVGAAFDFHAGVKRQAPRWMQKSGLEWLFRLISEPRRLATRYLINNPLFVILVLAQTLGIKRYPYP